MNVSTCENLPCVFSMLPKELLLAPSPTLYSYPVENPPRAVWEPGSAPTLAQQWALWGMCWKHTGWVKEEWRRLLVPVGLWLCGPSPVGLWLCGVGAGTYGECQEPTLAPPVGLAH